MKKTLLLLPFFSFSLFGQQSTVTLPNGVTVHEAPGVPTEPAPPAPVIPIRTVEDWNLAECIEGLSEVEFKIGSLDNTPENTERIERYQLYRARIIARKNSLTNSAH